jgi:Concanavalin A-like lectin/glucanases superfamily
MSNASSYLSFDGIRTYIEIPDSPDFSVPTTGQLTVSAWIQPETTTPGSLIFPTTEGGDESYVHWMGKGEAGQQEWTFRIYSANNTVGRANRISFYVFNLAGGEGVGSNYQDPSSPVVPDVWVHVVGAADTERTYIYINGQLIESNVYNPTITPQRGTAPLRIGTRDFNSYFYGQIREVRLWNRTLSAAEIQALYKSDTVPATGLVAEYLLTHDIAQDTADSHNGFISGGTWLPQNSS